ncbi:MAG TPA: hypothetical protein VNF71_08800, partial [Acidimicrobiales bacterium]|nr:hypothetical protein [Acidimicrobiales bacterium]
TAASSPLVMRPTTGRPGTFGSISRSRRWPAPQTLGGYWLLAADGGIFSFGNAGFYGSGAGRTGGHRAVGMVATGDGGGYWIILDNGAVLAKGDATPFSGPTSPTGPARADGHYTFEATNSAGAPIRWNPAEPITYAVADAGAPAGWSIDVNSAIAAAHAATGLTFASTGVYAEVSQIPSSVKVTVSWVSTLTTGDGVGLSTYWYYLLSGYTPQIVSAKVQLLSRLPAGGGSGEEPVLPHELGHAMRLGHASGAPEIMNPVDSGLATYQPGDLNGLWRIGATQGSTGFYW